MMGDVAEWYFGISKNSSPEPDFPHAGVELKVVPIERKGAGLGVSEPTSISQINYMTIVDERWQPTPEDSHPRASVRKKLDKILFVFYEPNRNSPLDARVRDVVLWAPDEVANAVFEIDWERTWQLVCAGRAHKLSQSIAEVLAPRPKGTGHGQLRRQPYNDEPAIPRAFALKTRFTSQIFEEKVLHHRFERVISKKLLERISHVGLRAAEERCLMALRPYVGWTVGELASETRVPLVRAKNLAASVVKRALGIRDPRIRARELEQWGFDVKTVGIRLRDGMPFESVSFPVYNLEELPSETWETCQLVDQLKHLIFVPCFARDRHVPQQDRVLGRPFGWTPSEDEGRTIRQEWEMFRQQILAGGAVYRSREPGGRRRDGLTHQKGTCIIHVRPHGKNRADVYRDPGGNLVTKRCFWLNARYVQAIVLQRAWPPPGRSEAAAGVL